MSTLRTDTLQTTDSSFTIQVNQLQTSVALNAYQADVANTSNPAKGAALVGYAGTTLAAYLGSLTFTQDFKAVNTIAALKALDSTKVKYAITAGYYTRGDTGGGALYYYDSSDTTSADDGGGVIVATDAARWKLNHNGTVNLEWFGAKPDGVTNCAAAMQAAFNVATVKEVVPGAGQYALAGSVTPGVGKSLRGIKGQGSSFTLTSAFTFVIKSNNSVSGCTFDCTAQTAGTYLFLLNTAAGSMSYITIEDNTTFSCKGFIIDDNHVSNIATNVRVRGNSLRLHKGPGYFLRNVFAFLEMRDNVVDFVGNVAAQNFVGFTINNNQGCYLDNCEVEGLTGIVAGTNGGQISFSFTNCLAIYLQRCFGDNGGGKGFSFTNCQYVRANECTASLNDDVGLSFVSCTDVQFNNMYVGGRVGLGGATAGIPACLINGCTRVSLNNINFSKATGDGILTAGTTTQLQISNGSCTQNAGRGLNTGTGSISITSNVLFANNTTGNYNLTTALDFLTGCQNNGGSLLNVTGPGAA
jgi:hypothetical protein